jgi:hypothetical protein
VPEFDAAALDNLLLLGLALLWAGVVKYLKHRVLPLGGEQPSGKRQGGWIYVHSSIAMKIMAAACFAFALVAAWFIYLAIGYLNDPAAFTGPGPAPETDSVVIGLFLALSVIAGGLYGTFAFVRTPMRFSESEILFRSALGREKPVRWRDVMNIDLRKSAEPVLRYRGWRRKGLCATCAGFREFIAYAQARGVEIVTRK